MMRRRGMGLLVSSGTLSELGKRHAVQSPAHRESSTPWRSFAEKWERWARFVNQVGMDRETEDEGGGESRDVGALESSNHRALQWPGLGSRRKCRGGSTLVPGRY